MLIAFLAHCVYNVKERTLRVLIEIIKIVLESLFRAVLDKLCSKSMDVLLARMEMAGKLGMTYIISIVIVATILTGDAITLLWAIYISLDALGQC